MENTWPGGTRHAMTQSERGGNGIMRLTQRQRQLLELMRGGEDCIQEGLGVWIGEERTTVATLLFFLRNCLLTGPDDSGGCDRYELSEWGVRALSQIDFDPQAELQKAVKAAREARG